MHFGISFDRDSIFIGGYSPDRKVGFHIDLPRWSDCCKTYGAPSRLYLRYWPGKFKSFDLPFKVEDPFAGSMSAVRRVQRSCSLCKDKTSEVVGYIAVDMKLKLYRGEVLGGRHLAISVCDRHATLFERNQLRLVDKNTMPA